MLTEQKGIQVDKFYAPVDWQYSFPEGYTRLEYLQSSGTQYIDTEIERNLSHTYRIVGSVNYPTDVTNRQLQGAQGFFYFGVIDGYWQIGQASNTHTNYTAQINIFYDYNVLFDTTQNKIFYQIGGISNNISIAFQDNPINAHLCLFSLNSLTLPSSCKNKQTLIYQDGTLVRNFVPTKRNSDNKPGMLDLANVDASGNYVFYTNAGTGEFVMGPELYSNNSQIDIRQKNNLNFVEKYKFNANNELIWANPQLNLSGPVGYKKVGSPTIVDNVASGFSSTNYLTISKFPNITNQWELNICFISNTASPIFTSKNIGIIISQSSSVTSIYLSSTSSSSYDIANNLTVPISPNIKGWIKIQYIGTQYIISYSLDGINYNIAHTINKSLQINELYTNPLEIGRQWISGRYYDGSIDLSQTYIKINNKLWFYGKNYTSENYAPVPAGFAYNNTTTPSIGYVNTQTQIFTPAPTDGIKYSQTRDIKVIPPEDNTITLLYGTNEVHHLPSEYEELQALQSSGTQYILFIQNDEEINIKSWEIIAEFNSTYLSDDYNGLFGFQYMQNRYGIFSNNAYSNNVLIKTYNNTTTKQKLITTLSEPIIFKYNDNDMFNGSLKNTSVLFGRNNTGVFVGSTIKIGPVKLYDDNGTLIRNLIPARRKSDSVLGMVDIADENKTFYTNQGTGTFTAVELKYKLFGFLAQVSSGTYDVYIDDVLYATTTSNTQTDIDFSALGSEYFSIGTCTTPEELVLHKIVIKPTTSGETITKFQCRRHSNASGEYQQSIIWTHFELENIINLSYAFVAANSYKNTNLISITSKNNNIKVNSLESTCRYCNLLKFIPKFELSNNTSVTFIFNSCSLLKRVTIEKGSISSGDFTGLVQTFNGTNNIEQINFNDVDSSNNKRLQATFTSNNKLKLLPYINPNNITYADGFISNAVNLYPTKINFSNKSNLEKITTPGTSSYPMRGLRGLKVSNEAPFTGTSPQIDVSYTGLDRDALVELFESMPYNVGYTQPEGSAVTITDGVASGFSVNDYLQIDNVDMSNGYEVFCKITTGNTLPAEATGIFSPGANQNGLLIRVNNNIQYLGYYTISTHDGSPVVLYISELPLTINTTYYCKFGWNKSKFYIEVSTDNTNWYRRERNSTYPLIVDTAIWYIGTTKYYGRVFNGSIDLNNTYIKIQENNQLVPFFTGNAATTKQINITAATGNNLTKVGTPTIDENGVASGFSNSNYLSLGESFTDTGKDLEFCVCINKTGTQNRPIIGVSNNYSNERPYFAINNYNPRFKIRNNVVFTSNYTIAQNTWYKIIFKRINGIYTISVYDTNNNLLDSTSLESSALIGNGVSQNFAFGHDKANYNAYWIGSIDLENTYIKVDNNYIMKGYLTDNDRLIATNKGWTITG